MGHPWRCLWRASLLQITYTTPRRRTILQFLQIFFTDGRTFIAHLIGSATAAAEQIRLLHETRVVMRHHVRLELRDEVHHHDNNDQ